MQDINNKFVEIVPFINEMKPLNAPDLILEQVKFTEDPNSTGPESA